MISIPAFPSLSNAMYRQTQRPLAALSYTWLFLAVRRSDMEGRPHSIRVNAVTFMEARKKISANYVACFAGRIPAIQQSPQETYYAPLPITWRALQARKRLDGLYTRRKTQ